MPIHSEFFLSGGTLPPNAPSYLTRRADAEIIELLRSSRSVYLLDSRQKGKSSLITRAIHLLTNEGIACIKLDLQRFGANLTPQQWYSSLGAAIAEQLQISHYPPITTAHQLIELILLWGSQNPNQKLTLLIDEIDFVRVLPFSADDFFAVVRSCLNARAEKPELSQITFCFIGSALPSQLTHVPSVITLDIGNTVYLDDFTLVDTLAYAKALPQNTSRPEKCIERIYHWANGHPYLTQSLCEQLCQIPNPTPDTVEKIIAETYLSPKAVATNSHLLQVAVSFLENLNEQPPSKTDLLEAYAKVLKKPCTTDSFTQEILERLRLSGLISIQNGIVSVRNNIYSRVFNKAWVKENLPTADLERQRRAAIKATVRTSFVGLAICSVLGWMALSNIQLAESRQKALASAIRSEGEANHAAYIGTMQSAFAEAANGNWMAARAAVEQLQTSSSRSWEWNYLHRMVNQNLTERTIPAGIKALAEHSPGNGFTAITNTGITWVQGDKVSQRSISFDPVRVFALSPGGKLVAFSEGNQGIVQEAHSGKEITKIPFLPLVFSENNQLLGWNTVTRKLSVVTPEGKLVAQAANTIDRPIIGAFSQNGQSVLCVSRFHAYLLHSSTLAVIQQWNLNNEPSSAIFNPHTNSFYLGYIDSPVQELAPNGLNSKLLDSNLAPIAAIDISQNGKYILIGRGDGLVVLYDAYTNLKLSEFIGHRARVASVKFIKNDSEILSGDDSGSVRTWRLNRYTDLLTDSGTKVGASASLSSDDKFLAVNDAAGIIWIYNLASHKQIARIDSLADGYCPVEYSSARRSFIVYSGSKGISELSPNSGSSVPLTPPFKAQIVSGRILPDGRSAVVAFADGTASLIDFSSGKSILIEKTPANIWLRIKVSADGKLLAVGHPNGVVSLWQLPTLKKITEWQAHLGVIRSFDFSPDGQKLASCGHDEQIIIYDLQTLKVSHNLKGHTSRVFECHFSPDSQRLLSYSFDGTARLWNVTSGKVAAILRHRSWLTDAGFNQKGDRIITTSSDRTMKLWDTRTGREVATLTGHTGTVFWGLFTSNSKTLISGGTDGRIFVRRTTPLAQQ